MVICINCEYQASDSKLCCNCRYNPLSMISLTDIKNKYNISEEELDLLDIYNVSFEMYGKYCYKYLWKQVDEYAYGIYKDMADCNEKKLFIKMHDTFLSIRNNIDNKIKKRNKLIQHINVYLEKSEYSDYVLDIGCLCIIESYINNMDVAPFMQINKILNEIKLYFNYIKMKELRKKEINEVIQKQNINVEECIDLRSYKNYIDSGSEMHMNIFKKDLENIKNKKDRQNELLELVKDLNITDVTMIKGWNNYIKYGYLSAYKVVIKEIDKIKLK